VTVLFTVQAIVACLFTLLARSYRGAGSWAVASFLAVIGSALYGGRGLIPDFYSVIVANTIYIIALCFLYYGVRQFLQLTKPPRLLYLLPVVVPCLIYYLTYVRDDIIIRSTFMSLFIVIMMVATARLLFLKSDRAVRRSHWFTAAVFLLFALFHALRIVPLFTVAPTSPLGVELLLSFPMIISSICGVLWTAGIALMITERLVVELQFTATHDFLTNILNRRAAQAQLENEIRRARQQESHLSILLMDVDHFKSINDRYGHATGDVVLTTLVQRLTEANGSAEMMARWGGEEFLILLPATSAAAAYQIAQSIQRHIGESPILVDGIPIACSLSIGVATAEPATANLDDLLRRADRALYHAKHAGRNTVSVDSPTPAEVAA
jgi:diguanylate cyclase (GGDEF)-like protein